MSYKFTPRTRHRVIVVDTRPGYRSPQVGVVSSVLRYGEIIRVDWQPVDSEGNTVFLGVAHYFTRISDYRYESGEFYHGQNYDSYIYVVSEKSLKLERKAAMEAIDEILDELRKELGDDDI